MSETPIRIIDGIAYTQRAIVAGLPVLVSPEDQCTPANWFAGLLLDFFVETFGWNGAIYVYHGSYWKALYCWLKDDV